MVDITQQHLLSCTAASALLACLLACPHPGAANDRADEKDDKAQREQSLKKANDGADEKDDKAQRGQSLKNMKRTAEQVVLVQADDRKQGFKLHENPVMRWSQPLARVKDGAIYIWSDRGRPQAICKLYTQNFERYANEWQSLSESSIIAERDGRVIWNPTEPGLTFRELPDAPKPGETAVERLRQMKSLAGQFSVTATFKPDSFDMRLLIQPLFRYEATKDILDGALFGYSIGTDPQTLLLLEARKKEDGYRWYYAVARMSTGKVTVQHGKKEVYSVEQYQYGQKNTKLPFIMLGDQPVPKE
jgi:hypothetical protein